MSERIRLAIILAEDERSASFLRRYVKRAMDVQKIRTSIAKDKGSAYDWVIKQYPSEVKEQRICVRAKNDNHAILVVHIDADIKTAAERTRQLATSLQESGAEARRQTERIAVCVPKRNTETWVHGLSGGIPEDEMDETYDFKKDQNHRVAPSQRKREELCGQRIGPAVERLFMLTRNNAPPAPQTMPSVINAVTELCQLQR